MYHYRILIGPFVCMNYCPFWIFHQKVCTCNLSKEITETDINKNCLNNIDNLLNEKKNNNICLHHIVCYKKYGSSTVQRSYTRISRISCLIYSLGKLKMDVHIHNTYFFIVNIVHIIHIQLITPGTTFFRRKIWS
jgi:hypothetical protein